MKRLTVMISGCWWCCCCTVALPVGVCWAFMRGGDATRPESDGVLVFFGASFASFGAGAAHMVILVLVPGQETRLDTG